MEDIIARIVKESQRVKEDFIRKNTSILIDLAEYISKAFKNDKKLMLCGNGGSAADAQHIAAEFVNRFQLDRHPQPARKAFFPSFPAVSAPVCGFLPVLAFLLTTTKVPKPAKGSLPFFFMVAFAVARKAFKDLSESAFVKPVLLAIADINSAFVMSLTLLFYFLVLNAKGTSPN